MILATDKTTLAYRCPHCGATVFSLVGIFSLTGDMVKLRCSCGESEATVTYTTDRKVRLAIPCIACPKPHHYTLGQTTFWNREGDVFRLSCPYTGIDICFIGEKDKVSAAVDKANDELLELMKSAGMEDISRMRDEEEEDDLVSENPLLHDVVFFALKDLEADDAIHCLCQGEKGEYTYRMHHGKVTVECEKCHGMATFPMTGVNSADEFLEMTSITLE